MTAGAPSGGSLLRALLGDGGDPDATLDMGKAERMGGLFWALGGLITALMLPFAPPTEAIGWPGWIVAGVGIAGCVGVAIRRFDDRVIPDLDEIFVAGCVGLAGIAALEWLGGGRNSPYDQLFVLPAIYAAAIHGGRRVLVFLTAVVLLAALPVTYEDLSREAVVDLAGQIVMLLALALVGRVLITNLRVQRGQLMRAQQEAEGLARRDALTGLGNRLAFQEALKREVERTRRSGGALSVLLGDVRNFKNVNDTLGHVRGDECLRLVARRIEASARANEECFRWGGDEFAVVLPDTRAEEATVVRERLSGDLGEGSGLRLELTCAVASLAEGGGPDDLLQEVDRVLVGLKGDGR